MIFPYPCGVVRAETGDAKAVTWVLRGAGSGRTDPAVGKPVGRRRRVAVPGGGRPGVRA